MSTNNLKTYTWTTKVYSTRHEFTGIGSTVEEARQEVLHYLAEVDNTRPMWQRQDKIRDDICRAGFTDSCETYVSGKGYIPCDQLASTWERLKEAYEKTYVDEQELLNSLPAQIFQRCFYPKALDYNSSFPVEIVYEDETEELIPLDEFIRTTEPQTIKPFRKVFVTNYGN
jgi:hypothetical protein